MTTEVDNTGTEEVVEATTPATKANAESRQGKTRDELEAELFETIASNAKYRTDNRSKNDRIRELEKEAQRGAELQDQLTKQTEAHRVEVAKVRLETLAVREGILDPVALAALDTSALKFDENGKAENLSEVLANFKTSHPSLFGSASTSSVAAVPPVQSSTTQTAKDMSAADFEKNWHST